MSTPLFSQVKKSFLKQPMTTSDTTMLVNALVDIYGNLMTIGSIGNPFYLTISPGGNDEEICSATGITQNADGTCTITGLTRGLSAVTPYTSGGTALNHGASTPVVFTPDNPQLFNSIIAYVNSLVLAAAVQASVTASGYVKLNKNNQNSRVYSTLVSEQGSPNMTVAVQAFNITTLDQIAVYAGGNSGSMTAPSVNPRIDLIVYDTVNTIIAVRTGAENASPSAPTPTTGDLLLAQVYHRVGSTKIVEQDDGTNSYIYVWYQQPSFYKTGLVTSASFPIVSEVDQSQTTSNSTITVGEANATTKHSILAQSFVPTVASIRGVKFWKIADTGTFTGSVKVSLQASTSGSPSASDLASFTITNAAWLKCTAAAEVAIQFTSQYESMVVGSTYWIVFTPSTSDNSNHPNIGANSAGGYASGILKYNNSTDGWVSISTSIAYFKTEMGTASKVMKLDSSGLIPAIIRPYSLVAISRTGVSNSSTSETTVLSIMVEGGFFTANSGIRVSFNGNMIDNSATYTIRVRFNGSIISTINETNSSATTENFAYITDIVNQASTSVQLYNVEVCGSTGYLSGTATGLVLHRSTNNGTAAIDVSGPGLIEVTVQVSSTASSQQISFVQGKIEKIG